MITHGFRVRTDSDSGGVPIHVRKSDATDSSRTQGDWSTSGDSLRPRTGPRPSHCGATLRDTPARLSFLIAVDDLSDPGCLHPYWPVPPREWPGGSSARGRYTPGP